jgi:DNA-binding response OmpR family regulator
VKNGFEVFKELARDNRPPVLFVTGDSGSFTVESQTALELWQSDFLEGTTDILYKPFSVEILFEKVAALIGDGEER